MKGEKLIEPEEKSSFQQLKMKVAEINHIIPTPFWNGVLGDT
jgi:hypothetical protein